MKLKRLYESIGETSIELDNTERLLQPDIKRANAMSFYGGSAGTVPAHWSNSTFLSGGKLTSAFGANPSNKKFRIMSYQEFVEVSNKSEDK